MARTETLHDIASTLLKPTEESQEAPQQEQAQAEEVAEEEQEIVEEEAEGGVLEADDEPDEEELDDPSEGDDEEVEAGDDDADPQPLEINDDDLIEVKIDGEVVYRSIADAKKALSGEGAYDKRIKEATELRQKAQADHSKMLERFAQSNALIDGVVQEMQQTIFVPQIQKPPESMKRANPGQYNRELQAYQADQARLNAISDDITKAVAKVQHHQQQAIETYKQEQAHALQQALPALADPKKGVEVAKDLVAVAKSYGFSEDEIKNALDHRFYLMAADLAQINKNRTVVRKGGNVADLKGQEAKRPRKLRSGATALKAREKMKAKQQQAVTDTARKSGKVKDVAQTLLK